MVQASLYSAKEEEEYYWKVILDSFVLYKPPVQHNKQIIENIKLKTNRNPGTSCHRALDQLKRQKSLKMK